MKCMKNTTQRGYEQHKRRDLYMNKPNIITYDKYKKAHCSLLEEQGTKACFNCPLDDCKCTAPMTQRESKENLDILYYLGVNNRTGGVKVKKNNSEGE